MNQPKIWLSSPHMGGSEQKYVKEAFDNNWIAPQGPSISVFQQDLTQYLEQDVYVAALSSGTVAIHLGLLLLGVKPGDEVLCQSMTFVASANPILYLGAIPIFIDSEEDTWNLCPIVLEEAIVDRIKLGKKPKAIVAVHLYGTPCKIEEIRAVADKYDILILEDSAEAIGSTYKGQKCGTFGDIGTLSFNGNKIITTSGGGAVVVKTKEIRDKAIFFATQSREDQPHYEHKEMGYNYRMSNICAAIGCGQLEVLEKHMSLRIAMHAFYIELFKNIKGVTVYCAPNEYFSPNYWLTSILIDSNITNGINREDLRLAFEAGNIDCRPLWKPMHLQPLYDKYPFYGASVAETLFESGLCLPSGSNLTDLDRERVASVVQKVFS